MEKFPQDQSLKNRQGKPGLFRRIRSYRERGAALILTLIFVSLLTIIVIAFYATMRVEQRASHAFADTQRAKMVAQGAVSHGIELLRANIPEPALISESAADAKGEVWVTNPGRLTIINDDGLEKTVSLHTGGADLSPDLTDDPDVHSVNLNEPLPGRDDPPIASAVDDQGRAAPDQSAPPMRVKWVPVLGKPSETASKENQILGRYAFWMDDESSKINFNVALGKPSRKAADPQGFWQQYDMGMMTPLFTSGAGAVEYNEHSRDREWALGRPRSVNLNVLFDDPATLDKNALLAHAFLRGFARYPEAILDYVNLPDDSKRDWFNANKFNLTFYSRSPEFNAFGRPRLFTTEVPLSLEAGPNYQLPFVYNGPEVKEPDFDIKGILHLNSLLGSLDGFDFKIRDDDDKWVQAGNLVNRAQLEMIMRYMHRKWPGNDRSFVDKYGERECYQMALSLLSMSRMATASISNKSIKSKNGFSVQWGNVSSSTMFRPPNGYHSRAVPERHFWRFDVPAEGRVGTEEVMMIPQSMGPFVTEVRLYVRLKPENRNGDPTKQKLRVEFKYGVEYYMPDMGPEVHLNRFLVKMDYLKIEPLAYRPQGMPAMYELGQPDPTYNRRQPDRNWNHQIRRKEVDDEGNIKRPRDRLGLGNLQLTPGTILVSRNSADYGKRSNKRAVPKQERIYVPMGGMKDLERGWKSLGFYKKFLPHTADYEKDKNGNKPREDRPLLIDPSQNNLGEMELKFSLRLGLSPRNRSGRAIQMIPMGDSDDPSDVLEATISLDPRLDQGTIKTVSWQIGDPRLSAHKENWILDEEDGGTPGAPNVYPFGYVDPETGEEPKGPLEPEDESTEKSKMRFFQRGPGRVGDPDEEGPYFRLNRPDEYNSRSRITSKGYWSMLHTGMQGNPERSRYQKPVQWRTLDLGGSDDEVAIEAPPDHLLLDIIGATYPMQHDQWKINSTLPDEFSTVSFMNSTAGQVNLNSKIYPADSPYFQPPKRTKPLEAVFKHLRTDAEIEALLSNLDQYQSEQPFYYTGDLSKVDGYRRRDVGSTQFEHEELLRNMIGSLTTNSNTFGLWGVSQVVKKVSANEDWGTFQDGDRVLAEKRFFAVIERYIWPGNDGVPGNGHVDINGKWDRIAEQGEELKGDKIKREVIPYDGGVVDRLFQLPGSPPLFKEEGNRRLQLDRRGTYPWFDGPQEVEMDRFVQKAMGAVKWTYSSLEEAYNPPQPVIKYRVAYFKYLDE